jgi:hypothetical protein
MAECDAAKAYMWSEMEKPIEKPKLAAVAA